MSAQGHTGEEAFGLEQATGNARRSRRHDHRLPQRRRPLLAPGMRRRSDRVPGLDADDLFREILQRRDWYWSDPERHRIGRANLSAASISIVDWSLRRLGFDLPDLAHDLGLSYRRKREERAELFPGAVEALRRFRSQGIGLALITNGTRAARGASWSVSTSNSTSITSSLRGRPVSESPSRRST